MCGRTISYVQSCRTSRSLRKASINRRLADALTKLAAAKLELTQIPLDALPMLNEDLFEPEFPASVIAMKNAVTAADAALFITPEYNRAAPAVIKNAIDWGSRPWGKSVWSGKPVALAGMSLGNTGTAVAQASLRTTLIALDAHLLGQPELYLTYKEGLIGDDLGVTDERIAALLTRFVDRFDGWIRRTQSAG